MSTPRPATLFAIDDHPMFREGLQALVGTEPRLAWCGHAETAGSGLDACMRLRPDVVVVDMRLPDGDGLDVVAALTRDLPTARSVVLSTFAGEDRIRRALTAGASGYLPKTTPGPELLDALIRVADGGRVLPQAIADELAAGFSRESLTPREREVLAAMARGLSNKAIARALTLSPGTVRTHVQHILEKLECSQRTEAVGVGLRRGYIDAE